VINAITFSSLLSNRAWSRKSVFDARSCVINEDHLVNFRTIFTMALLWPGARERWWLNHHIGIVLFSERIYRTIRPLGRFDRIKVNSTQRIAETKNARSVSRPPQRSDKFLVVNNMKSFEKGAAKTLNNSIGTPIVDCGVHVHCVNRSTRIVCTIIMDPCAYLCVRTVRVDSMRVWPWKKYDVGQQLKRWILSKLPAND
jgi:hypothetical protein